jgi:hypothetical protein
LQRGQTDVIANPESARIGTCRSRRRRHRRWFAVRAFASASDSAEVSREETLRGRVGVSAAGRSVSVGRGQGTIARVGEPPIKPVPLLAAPDVSTLPARFEQLPLRFPLPQLMGAVAWLGEIAPIKSFDRMLLSKNGAWRGTDLRRSAERRLRSAPAAADINGLQGRSPAPLRGLRAAVLAGLNRPGRLGHDTYRDRRSPGAKRRRRPLSPAGCQRAELRAAAARCEQRAEHLASARGFASRSTLLAGRQYRPAAGQQGPWRPAAGFTYKPAPGAVDLGRSAIEITSETIELKLPQAPDGLSYEAILSSRRPTWCRCWRRHKPAMAR